MAGKTPRFGFTTFGSSQDTLALQNYKAFGSDRELLDRLLTYALEKHRHTGIPLVTTQPEAPLVTASHTGGALLPNQTIFYRTSVVDAAGQEQRASKVATATTGPQVIDPSPPTLSTELGAGSLLPGDYLYQVSAYTDTNDRETLPSRAAKATLSAIGSIAVLLPYPPSGTTGWNIYRKGPTDYEPMHLTSVGIGVTVVDDDGLVASRLRPTPEANTTSTSYSVTVDVAGGLPDGHTCKIYRTYDATNWDHSLLAWTGVLPYVDGGYATRAGYPSANSTGVAGAPKIELGANTIGRLPPGLVTATTFANFNFTGPVQVGISPWQWVCEYDDVILVSFRANLGRDSTPAADPVQVALEYRAYGATSWLRYQTVGLADVVADIPVGETVGNAVYLDYLGIPQPRLGPGDALRPVVLQAGGGDTPTDENLTVAATLAVHHGSANQTYNWET